MVERFCCVNGGAFILMQGTGRVIVGTTPVSVMPAQAQTAEFCAFCIIPKYSPPAPPPVIITFVAHPPPFITPDTMVGWATEDAFA